MVAENQFKFINITTNNQITQSNTNYPSLCPSIMFFLSLQIIRKMVEQPISIYNYNNLNDHIAMTQTQKPIQLISFDKNKQIVVNHEAIEWLHKVNQDKHLGVITVVGKYRTGKSYILNRVLLKQNSGFEVGPTINACTKGLWVWPELIQNPNDPSVQYMVMDTEGLGSLEEGEQTDTKIFLMAMLLSSYFIYNSTGNIDEKAIQSLSLIVNLSKLLQKGSQQEMQQIVNCFPSFMWLVRDFALRLVDENNIPISPQQYLQNAIKLQNGTSDQMIKKNSIRKELMSFFRDRDCFMLVRPVDDETKLQNMAKLKDSELRPKFLELVGQLRGKVLNNVKKKLFKGKPCSPAMFIQLCQYFCDSINKGGLPEIENSWDLVCKAEAARVEKRIFTDYEMFVKKYETMDSEKIIMTTFENQFAFKIQQQLKFFEKNALGQKGQKKRLLKQKMMEVYEKQKKKISSSKNSGMNKVIDQMNEKIEEDIHSQKIKSVFDVVERYDSLISNNEGTMNAQTLSHLYRKSYEGLRSNIFTYFGNNLQNQNFEKQIIQQKLNFFESSYNRVHNDHSKAMQQSEGRVKQLTKSVYELQLKALQAQQELNNAKTKLTQFTTQQQNSKMLIN